MREIIDLSECPEALKTAVQSRGSSTGDMLLIDFDIELTWFTCILKTIII